MTVDEIREFLTDRFPGQSVSYLGSGSDSIAFRVGTRVFRFTGRGGDIYRNEARVCDAVRPAIDIPIPKIDIFDRDGVFYVAHEMICGHKWSWHKFMWQPGRQRNLADSCAKFLAQLHGVDTAAACGIAPHLGQGVAYIDFDDVADQLGHFMTPRQAAFFRRNYERIISAPVHASDMVICHLGLKGANSVVDCDGNLCGVFDFCNCGIYERGRDLVLMSISRNRRLYRRFLKSYRKISGANVSTARIADLAAVEFLWAKRWFSDGRFCPLPARFIKKNLASALGRFYGLPRFLNWVVYARLSLTAARAAARK